MLKAIKFILGLILGGLLMYAFVMFFSVVLTAIMLIMGFVQATESNKNK